MAKKSENLAGNNQKEASERDSQITLAKQEETVKKVENRRISAEKEETRQISPEDNENQHIWAAVDQCGNKVKSVEKPHSNLDELGRSWINLQGYKIFGLIIIFLLVWKTCSENFRPGNSRYHW